MDLIDVLPLGLGLLSGLLDDLSGLLGVQLGSLLALKDADKLGRYKAWLVLGTDIDADEVGELQRATGG